MEEAGPFPGVVVGRGCAVAGLIGRTAEVEDQSKGETVTWTLVGSTEANLAEGKLSAESPIGAALMDAEVGSTVDVFAIEGATALVHPRE